MDSILQTLYQERAGKPSTLGIVLVEKRERLSSLTNTFDAILLVIISNKGGKYFHIKHYLYEDKKIGLYTINERKLFEWLTVGNHREIYDWFYNGKIIFDRNGYIKNLIQNLNDFPFRERKLRMGIEFANLIGTYNEGKMLFENKDYMDSYHQIVLSLHHLGRIALIEKGIYPEITVWNQLKQIDPEIYKVYEELIMSEEPLNKRIELLILAVEFFIQSRTELGVAHILDVVGKNNLWTIQQLVEHNELELYGCNLFNLVEYLIEKNILEAAEVESKGGDIKHRYFRRASQLF